MSVLSAKGFVPLSLMQVLDRAFRIYRENFFTIILPVFMFTVPTGIFSTLMTDSMLQEFERSTFFASEVRRLEASVGLYGRIFVILAATLFLQSLLVNSLMTLIASDSQFGTKPTFRTLLDRLGSRLPTLIGSLVFVYFIGALLWIGMAIISFGCGFGFGLALYVTVTLYAFIVPVVILEDVDVGLALRRAWWLAKARFWAVLAIVFFSSLISSTLNLSLVSLIQLISDGVLGQLSETVSEGLTMALQVLATTIVTPILPLSLTLLYFDTRIRLEAFDVMMEIEPPLDYYRHQLVSPQPPGSLFVGADIGNIVKLSLGTIGLGIGLYGLGLILASMMR